MTSSKESKGSKDTVSRKMYEGFTPGSKELVEEIVKDHMGWSISIAKNIARAWNLDWQIDGLDGGAYEALVFCAGRFDPAMGVPFRGYARRRIHEASTEEAKKSKAWAQSTGACDSEIDAEARELSAKIFDLFPELRDGFLPSASSSKKDEDSGMRGSIKQLITGASLISAFNDSTTENQEHLVDHKRLVELLSTLEPVHQEILWAIYYQGLSMRAVADLWGLDDLAVMREHKEIIEFLSEKIGDQKNPAIKALKVRRGLRVKSIDMKKKQSKGTFSEMLTGVLSSAIIIFTLMGIF